MLTSGPEKDDFEGASTFLTFKQLTGISVSNEEVIEEIKKHPLDGILGYVAGLSLEMMQSKEGFFDPRIQGAYLKPALVDEFPHRVRNAYKMYAPGRVPNTGGRHIFIHEQNLAWVSHASLLYADRSVNAPEFTYSFVCRMCRLLLIANDFVAEEPSPFLKSTLGSYDLRQRRYFAHAWIRRDQFNRFVSGSNEILMKLARQKLLLEIMPRYYTDLASDFLSAVGISIERYQDILVLFLSHIYGGMKKGSHWLSKATLCSQIKANKAEIENMLSRWSRTPDEYRLAFKKWRNERQAKGELPVFDFVPLRETPLIEARLGEWVCPVPFFLLSKIEDEVFFILSDYLKGKKRTRFHTAAGNTYEDYAHELVDCIGNCDKGGKWFVRRNVRTKQGEELADSYLQRGEIAVLFEHKGKRASTDFLCGGSGDRVIGPSDEFLTNVEGKRDFSLMEGQRQDEGLFTQGMWQQSKAGHRIIEWAEKETGIAPKKIFPIVTSLCSLRVDSVIRLIYINPLIDNTGLYAEDFWERPQWITISDLESLAQVSERGDLNLEELLQRKSKKKVNRRFDVFLFENKMLFPGRKLVELVDPILDGTAMTFFKRRLTEKSRPT